ncbi:MAG: YceI family protein [Bacteriovorax sp.]|nr:YceI family protein [Bacteriovorax sp.]
MKKLFIFVLFLSFQVGAAVKYLPGEYKVDPDHTRVGFLIQHFMISLVEGRFNDVKGTLVLAPKFTDSSVEAIVDINSVDTAVKKRDEDLLSERFFDAIKYPTMSLKSKKFKGKPEAFTLVADLTIKDVTKEVTFKGAYTGEMSDPWGNDRVAINMTAKINRKDFHINYNEKASNGPAIGDEVTIIVRGDGVKKGSAAK